MRASFMKNRVLLIGLFLGSVFALIGQEPALTVDQAATILRESSDAKQYLPAVETVLKSDWSEERKQEVIKRLFLDPERMEE